MVIIIYIFYFTYETTLNEVFGFVVTNMLIFQEPSNLFELFSYWLVYFFRLGTYPLETVEAI
jgi:hypothetical protein